MKASVFFFISSRTMTFYNMVVF